MRRLFTIIIFTLLYSITCYTQVNSPSLRCLSVNTSGDVTLTWVIPTDPNTTFFSYDVFSASTSLGPFTKIATLTSYNQTTYTHSGANANTQSQYYYLTTNWGVMGVNTSSSSDTLRTLFLNLTNPGNGLAVLNWNATHTPLLTSSNTNYGVLRKHPVTGWSQLTTSTGLAYKDTISVCSIFYNYQIEISDASGCVSSSNSPGGLFTDLTAPKIPQLDSVSLSSTGQAQLGWQASTSLDATAYVIYINQNGAWIPIDTVYGKSTTVYTNPNSLAHTTSEDYCLATLDSCGNISPLGQNQKTILLNVSYNLCERSSKLTWSNYVNLPNNIKDYEVFCSTNAGNYSYIGTSSNNSFTHTGLIPGNNYCYYVRVVNTSGAITASSNRSCISAIAAATPNYIYIKTATVNQSQTIDVNYYVDNSKSIKGFSIFRSTDGLSFEQVAYQAYTTGQTFSYTDTDVNVSQKNYYYRIDVADSCGNQGISSNIAKTILLQATHASENTFQTILSWDDYSTWLGNITGYNIYRAINGVFDATPIATVPFGIHEYIDNVQDYYSEEGKFSYYVEAIEGAGNIYNFNEFSASNRANVYIDATVFVPNAFSPKGLNSIWLPISQYVEKSDYRVVVFNRWGDKLFETTDDKTGWDGSGSTDDIYIYIIQYKNARGESIELKGHFVLLR